MMNALFKIPSPHFLAGGLGRSQSREHARTIRALLSGWSVHEIHALVEEYETLMTIRDLTIEAEIAR